MLERTLERGALEPDRLSRYLGTIRGQVARLTGLVGDLLDLSRLQTGQLALAAGPVDLGRLAAAVVDRQRDVLEAGAAPTITLQVELDEPVISGDEARLDQVLTNLLSNAVKYSPPGSAVEVRVTARAGQVRITVVDHGMGVPPAERDALFTPFNRITAARASGVEGTGFGLYITRRIVVAHGGTIEYRETPGGGATFEVRLLTGARQPAPRVLGSV